VGAEHRHLTNLLAQERLALAVALFAVTDLVVDLGAPVLASVADNLPAYLVVEPFTGSIDRLLTALVAVNVSPVLLAWGSLANLLWLRSPGRSLGWSACLTS
jgi:arsenical pump membrane protein